MVASCCTNCFVVLVWKSFSSWEVGGAERASVPKSTKVLAPALHTHAHFSHCSKPSPKPRENKWGRVAIVDFTRAEPLWAFGVFADCTIICCRSLRLFRPYCCSWCHKPSCSCCKHSSRAWVYVGHTRGVGTTLSYIPHPGLSAHDGRASSLFLVCGLFDHKRFVIGDLIYG